MTILGTTYLFISTDQDPKSGSKPTILDHEPETVSHGVVTLKTFLIRLLYFIISPIISRYILTVVMSLFFKEPFVLRTNYVE